MREKIRHRLHEILEAPEPKDTPSTVFNVFITTLIILNVIFVSMETVKGLSAQHRVFFKAFEIFSVIVFTIEYLLRLWTITVNPHYRKAGTGRLRYIATPFALVDLVAILPFYILLFLPALGIFDLRFIRAARLLRLLRVAKLGRFAESLHTLTIVAKRTWHELLITLMALFVLLIITAGVMYYVENPAQPQAFSSIPASMWWAVAALTTVGYGDIYPITPLGKLLGGVVAVMGVGLFGLPAGILAAGFIEEIRSRHRKVHTCPHCGKPLE